MKRRKNMSSTNKRKYTVVLYQAGLGTGHDYFNPTLEKIDKVSTKNIVFNESGKSFYNSFLEMKLI